MKPHLTIPLHDHEPQGDELRLLQPIIIVLPSDRCYYGFYDRDHKRFLFHDDNANLQRLSITEIKYWGRLPTVFASILAD